MNLQYAGSEDALDDPYTFAPNGDVSGQPPVFILNSDVDVLRASGEAYADALRAAGVDVTVEMEPETRHGHVNEPEHPGASRSIERITTWLRDHAVATIAASKPSSSGRERLLRAPGTRIPAPPAAATGRSSPRPCRPSGCTAHPARG